MRTRRANSLGLAPFLAELAAQLRALPAAELHARLLAHAEQLPADQRAGFLALFTGEPPLAAVPPAAPTVDMSVVRVDRLGGLIHEYAQVA